MIHFIFFFVFLNLFSGVLYTKGWVDNTYWLYVSIQEEEGQGRKAVGRHGRVRPEREGLALEL